MISPENVIKEVIQPLKDEGKFGFYHYGNEYELKRLFNNQKYQTKYPFIWLVLPLDGNPSDDIQKNLLDCRIKLILATNTNKSWLNDKRNIETYDKVLNPLYDDLISTFTKSLQVVIKDNEVNVLKVPNYHQEEDGTRSNPAKHKVNYYWDVLKVEFDAILRNNCNFK